MKKSLKLEPGAVALLWLLVFIGWLAAGCASTNRSEDTKPPSTVVLDGGKNTAPNGEPFAVGDLVIVKFSGTSVTIAGHEERIKEDDTITLPLIGAVKADGKTRRELEREIYDLYHPDYGRRPSITVINGQSFYFVGGQVRSCGRLLYVGPTTVTKAIESAGGFTEYAARRRVELVRTSGKTFVVDCVKAERDPSFDLPVYPGDRIEVDRMYATTPPGAFDRLGL
jgi:protein involved in polysaccharide export with SLBB domain